MWAHSFSKDLIGLAEENVSASFVPLTNHSNGTLLPDKATSAHKSEFISNDPHSAKIPRAGPVELITLQLYS